jgi:hypothetical protein
MVHDDNVTVPPVEIIKPPAKDAVFPLMVHDEMTATMLEWTATPPP